MLSVDTDPDNKQRDDTDKCYKDGRTREGLFAVLRIILARGLRCRHGSAQLQATQDPLSADNNDKRCPQRHQRITRSKEIDTRETDKNSVYPAGLHRGKEKRQENFTQTGSLSYPAGLQGERMLLSAPLRLICHASLLLACVVLPAPEHNPEMSSNMPGTFDCMI